MNINWLYLLLEIASPVIMIIIGTALRLHPPAFGSTGGYSSKAAKTNEAAWNAAQIIFGKAMSVLAIPAAIIGVIAGALGVALDFGEDFGAIILVIVVVVQSVLCAGAVVFVEKQLSRIVKK